MDHDHNNTREVAMDIGGVYRGTGEMGEQERTEDAPGDSCTQPVVFMHDNCQ